MAPKGPGLYSSKLVSILGLFSIDPRHDFYVVMFLVLLSRARLFAKVTCNKKKPL